MTVAERHHDKCVPTIVNVLSKHMKIIKCLPLKFSISNVEKIHYILQSKFL